MERTVKIVDYEIIKNFDWIYSKRIVLYGSKYWAQVIYDILQNMGVSVYKVVQSLPDDRKFLGKIKIEPVERLCGKEEESFLIILASYAFYTEMIENLTMHHLTNISACTLYGFFIAIMANQNNKKIPLLYQKELNLHYGLNKSYQRKVNEWININSLQNLNVLDDSIILYQAGKVGSNTLYNAIKNAGKSCHHIHSMLLPFLYGGLDIDSILMMKELFLQKPRKLISIVRNPFARDFSSFFQATETYTWPATILNEDFFLMYDGYLEKEKFLDSAEYEKRQIPLCSDIVKMCESYLLKMVELRSDQFSWYDYEMKEFLGIDVYQCPFDKKSGYQIIKNGQVELLLFKIENLNHIRDVIEDFVGKKLDLYNSNRHDEKIYKFLYQQVLTWIHLPHKYIEYYKTNPKALHFYSEQELSDFIGKFPSINDFK